MHVKVRIKQVLFGGLHELLEARQEVGGPRSLPAFIAGVVAPVEASRGYAVVAPVAGAPPAEVFTTHEAHHVVAPACFFDAGAATGAGLGACLKIFYCAAVTLCLQCTRMITVRECNSR